jgi:hypothetical protein
MRTVRVFRQKFTLEDAIGSHACSFEANMRVTNGIPLGCSLLLPVDTVNSVQTRKAPALVKIAEDAGQPVPDWLLVYKKAKAAKQWAVSKIPVSM